MSSPAPSSEIEKDLIRQGERTVDNLKRLFAFVFAISFGVAAGGAIEKMRPLLTDPGILAPPLIVWFINFEMLAVFVITAGVFYHQGTKFLDNRYARHPLTEAHPFGFAWDYLTLIITMVPFFFMAHALHPSISQKVGYTWFFGFYVVLLSSGLILLMLAQIRHSNFVRTILLKEIISVEEIRREGLLRTYWLLMNSFILLAMLVIFFIYVRSGVVCPTSSRLGLTPYFLFWFGGLALLRDYLDYRYSWRFLYPVRPETAPTLDRWPLTHIRDSNRPLLWALPSYIFIAICFAIVYHLRLWDFSHWVALCKVS